MKGEIIVWFGLGLCILRLRRWRFTCGDGCGGLLKVSLSSNMGTPWCFAPNADNPRYIIALNHCAAGFLDVTEARTGDLKRRELEMPRGRHPKGCIIGALDTKVSVTGPVSLSLSGWKEQLPCDLQFSAVCDGCSPWVFGCPTGLMECPGQCRFPRMFL